MREKFLLLASGIGLLFVILFILINPSLFGHSIIPNFLSSDYSIIKIQMFSYYLLTLGILLFLIFFILSKFAEHTILKLILWFCILAGLMLITLSLLFNPDFLVEKFTKLNFLIESGRNQLFRYQIFTLILGYIILFFALLFYVLKYFRNGILYVVTLSILGIMIFSIMFYFVFINVKYPSNILLRSGTYSKVKQIILGQNILLSDFDPQPTLKLNRKKIIKAKYPVIDVNAHLSSAFSTDYDKKVLAPENLIKSMDSVGLQIIFNTDVKGGDLEKVLNTYSRKYPNRFRNLWPTGFPAGIMSDERLAELPGELEKAVKMGAIGEGELWKYLGVKTKDKLGKVLAVDDVRIDPFWAKAGELGVPILWHMGDPASMFQPIDRFNERYVELRSYPDWSFYGSEFPSRETIMKGRENVLRKHPKTIIIGCHMGWNSDNLAYAGYLLDTYPNYYLDMSTTLSELGRQPHTSRKFFIKYQDRIVFGTDGGSLFGVKGWTVEKFYQAHWEFLETENEYIDYPMQGAINQGSWKIYGINLPDTVLQKIYYKNAAKLFNIKLDIDPQ